jgi:hypothetical protein
MLIGSKFVLFWSQVEISCKTTTCRWHCSLRIPKKSRICIAPPRLRMLRSRNSREDVESLAKSCRCQRIPRIHIRDDWKIIQVGSHAKTGNRVTLLKAVQRSINRDAEVKLVSVSLMNNICCDSGGCYHL